MLLFVGRSCALKFLLLSEKNGLLRLPVEKRCRPFFKKVYTFS